MVEIIKKIIDVAQGKAVSDDKVDDKKKDDDKKKEGKEQPVEEAPNPHSVCLAEKRQRQ